MTEVILKREGRENDGGGEGRDGETLPPTPPDTLFPTTGTNSALFLGLNLPQTILEDLLLP